MSNESDSGKRSNVTVACPFCKDAKGIGQDRQRFPAWAKVWKCNFCKGRLTHLNIVDKR